MNGEHKITSSHRERTALIYLRQSSMAQVREHTGSTRSGVIFGIEITRLARSNADVARLAEFARITGTLLIDPGGGYDPADVATTLATNWRSSAFPRWCRRVRGLAPGSRTPSAGAGPGW